MPVSIGGQLGAIAVSIGMQLGVRLHRARLAKQLGLLHWRLICNAGEIKLQAKRRLNSDQQQFNNRNRSFTYPLLQRQMRDGRQSDAAAQNVLDSGPLAEQRVDHLRAGRHQRCLAQVAEQR